MVFVPMIEVSKKNILLHWLSYIHHPVQFKKDKKKTLIDSSINVNVIILTYVAKLELKVCYTKIEAWKIDNSTLKNFGMVLASFQMEDK